MLSYRFLLDLALILLSTKVLGLITRKFQMPQVVGALLAGLILGPAMLNILSETDFIIQLSELGVIVLMFNAGLESDLEELKKTGKASFKRRARYSSLLRYTRVIRRYKRNCIFTKHIHRNYINCYIC